MILRALWTDGTGKNHMQFKPFPPDGVILQ